MTMYRLSQLRGHWVFYQWVRLNNFKLIDLWEAQAAPPQARRPGGIAENRVVVWPGGVRGAWPRCLARLINILPQIIPPHPGSKSGLKERALMTTMMVLLMFTRRMGACVAPTRKDMDG